MYCWYKTSFVDKTIISNANFNRDTPKFSVRSYEETADRDAFDAGIKSITDNRGDDLMPHFIYCGMHYFWDDEDKLRTTLLNKMRNSGIQTAMLTMLNMWRCNLVTKETVKQAYDGKLKNEINWNWI